MIAAGAPIGDRATTTDFLPAVPTLNQVQTETGCFVERDDSLTAGERRGCVATEHPAADEDLQFVRQASAEEGPDDHTPSLHQDRLHISCREAIEEGLQVHLVLAEA